MFANVVMVFIGVVLHQTKHRFLFVLILYAPSTIFQICREGSSWVESVLS